MLHTLKQTTIYVTKTNLKPKPVIAVYRKIKIEFLSKNNFEIEKSPERAFYDKTLTLVVLNYDKNEKKNDLLSQCNQV